MKFAPACSRLALLAALLLSAACARSSLKTTPLWDSDYSRGNGPAENRVNVWPLLYWRDPALSVLWPIVNVADDANAVIPLYEYNKPDGDLRIGTLPLEIPPLLAHLNRDEDWQRILLAYHNGKTKEFDVFPVLFHTPGSTWTPLFVKRPHLRGALGGLLSRYADDDLTQWNLPWPLAGWWSGSQENGSKLIPLYYYNHDGDSRTLNAGVFVYHREQSPDRDSTNYLFPLGAFGRDGGEAWNRLIPLWYSKQDREGRRFYSLPLVRDGDGKSSLTLAMLAAYVDRETTSTRYQAWAWPIVHRFSGPDASGHAVVPLYLYEQTPGGVRTFYSPLASWSSDGRFVNAGVVLFNQTDKDGRKSGAVLWPLVRWWDGKEERGSSVLPLYYRNDAGEESSTLITLAGGRSHSPERDITDILGPAYFEKAMADGDRYYRTILWPFWNEGAGRHNRWNALLPLYFWERNGEATTFASIPYFSSGDGGDVSRGILLDLIGWSSSSQQHSLDHHVFPLYSWSSSDRRAELDLGLSLLAEFDWSRAGEAALRDRMTQSIAKQFAEREASARNDRAPGFPSVSAYESLFERSFLVFADGSSGWLDGRAVPLADGEQPAPGETILTDAGGKRWRVVIDKHLRSHVFLLYNHEIDGDASARREILWRLFDSVKRTNDDGSVYERQRVLWRLFHRETQAGHTSVDVFPFVAYDRDEKADSMQWSFAGGLLGWKREGEKRGMKLFYLPIGG